MKNLINKIARKLIPKSLSSEYIELGKRKAFKGKDFYCPCCEESFKTFLPYGLKLRLNALCPQCNSLERHRLLWVYLQKHTNLFQKQGRLFHVAPENLLFKKFKKQQHIEYFPCAKFGEGYEDTYATGTMNIDITAIPYQNDYFDYIICNHVLEHIPEDVKSMKELCRVLKPGGWAILQVPIDTKRESTFEDFSVTDPTERESLFGQKDHVRVYGMDYLDRLQHAGFSVKVDNFAQQLDPVEAFRLGINTAEDIYLCSKK